MRVFLVTVYGLGLTERFVLRATGRNDAERDACCMFHVITNGITPEAILT